MYKGWQIPYVSPTFYSIDGAACTLLMKPVIDSETFYDKYLYSLSKFVPNAFQGKVIVGFPGPLHDRSILGQENVKTDQNKNIK